MRQKKKANALGVTPILIGGLMLSLLLVLIADGARLLAPKTEDRVLAEILLENLDAETARVLSQEQTFSIEGSEPCPVERIGETSAQPIRQILPDGRILLLPSEIRFRAKVTVVLSGRRTEDGFLAFGNRRLLPGTHVQLLGKRTSSEGLLLSIYPAEETKPASAAICGERRNAENPI